MVCHNIRTVFVYSMQNVVYANLVRVLDVRRNTLKRRALHGEEDTGIIPRKRYNKIYAERVNLYERYSINKAYQREDDYTLILPKKGGNL